jgi:hypothetical protein
MVEEKIYPIILPELDPRKWENRIFNDNKNFLNDLNVPYDEKGIIGENLFPLSLDNTHQDVIRAIRSLKVISGETVDKEIFTALCPELENFVSFVNWLGSVDSRNNKHLEYKKKIKSFLEDTEGKNICVIKGNYRISKENYAVILPFRGEFDIVDNKDPLEWEFAPYLKRTSETFSAYPSPIFTSPINDLSLGGDSKKEKKLFCFTAPFIFQYSDLDELTLKIVSGTSPAPRDINKIKSALSSKNFNILTKEKEGIFIGLFANIIDENKKWSIYLINISRNKLSGEDLIAHLLITRMYYNYLINLDSLLVSELDSLKRYIKTLGYQTEKTFNMYIPLIDFEKFYKKYLEGYFYINNNQVYYIPKCLKGECREIGEFLEYLKSFNSRDKCNGNEWLMKIGITKVKQFEKSLKVLNFIKQYNTYSKRDLIELIKTHRRKIDNTWKWQI